MREKYESLSAAVLKELAKARGIKSVSAMKKSQVIEAMLAEDAREQQEKAGREQEEKQEIKPEEKTEERHEEKHEERHERENGEYRRNREVRESREPRENRSDRPPMDLAQLDSGVQVSGILEVMPDGYGFIRSANYLPGENDVYVSPSQIRRFGLKTGDIISGNTRIKAQQEKFSALLYLKTINDMTPAEAPRRYNFEDMTPIFPNQRLRMERDGREIAMRIVDLISPIGKGQRGMIVSPPKAGKTTLLKETAKSILRNDPDMHLIILLIDERPEEVTDMMEAIRGDNVEVIYSTFDELPEHHKRVSEMVIERAKRLVEHKKDVTILLDSITRLARAYNLTVPPSGRTLSGGLDPAALHMPKRFSARPGICGRAAALPSWLRPWWIREARWTMWFTRNLREPATWNWYWTGSFPREGYSPPLTSRNPAPDGRIFFWIPRSWKPPISCARR